MGYGIQTQTASATTTPTSSDMDRIWSILLRCPSSNTDAVHVNLGKASATTGQLQVRSGETLAIDISPTLIAKILSGTALEPNDFIRSISFRSASGTQTLLIDALRWDDA